MSARWKLDRKNETRRWSRYFRRNDSWAPSEERLHVPVSRICISGISVVLCLPPPPSSCPCSCSSSLRGRKPRRGNNANVYRKFAARVAARGCITARSRPPPPSPRAVSSRYVPETMRSFEEPAFSGSHSFARECRIRQSSDFRAGSRPLRKIRFRSSCLAARDAAPILISVKRARTIQTHGGANECKNYRFPSRVSNFARETVLLVNARGREMLAARDGDIIFSLSLSLSLCLCLYLCLSLQPPDG